MENKNKFSLIAISILSILSLGLASYIGYEKIILKDKCNSTVISNNTEADSSNKKDEIKDSSSEENQIIDSKNNNDDIKKTESDTSKDVKCYGTYYVNGNKNEGIYTLKKDGTYTVENEENFGVFTINENTITFIQMKHTSGPREEDPIYYNPKSYLISDDCSNIRLTESGSHTSAYLEKAN